MTISNADDKTRCGGDRGLQQLVVTAVVLASCLHCTANVVASRPVLYPATPCRMAQDVSRVQKLKISFGILLNHVSLSVCDLTITWLDRKLQDLSSNQRTSVHGPRPVRWCTTQVQNSSNTFLASSHQAKYTAFCIQPNCGTP